MKIRKNRVSAEDKIELQMTPMIDIVFQLLVFFIMTFKIVSMEGDFNIKMPLAAPRQGPPQEELIPPIKVRLAADDSGRIRRMEVNSTPFSKWEDLQNKIISLVEGGPAVRESAEVELDCDANLNYEHVIAAITSVSGYVNDGKVTTLVEKIKFSPPKE